VIATAVIVNPASANGATGRRWPHLARLLHDRLAALGTYNVLFTDRPGSATVLARRALKEGAQLVVSVGGDGTQNEVVNGFFEGITAVSPQAAFGFLPAGTGGDLRRSFDWSGDAEAAAERLRGGHHRSIDLGRITTPGTNGIPIVRHFVNVASFGISGVVDRMVTRSPRFLGGRASFALASLRALRSYRDQTVALSLDGGPPMPLSITTVAIANGQYFGGGMRVAPKAVVDDGLFDVIVLGGFGLKDFLLRSNRLYHGTHLQLPGVHAFRARRVEARSEQRVLLDMDGEQPGELPATFEVLPKALRLWGCTCGEPESHAGSR
jgi:YegS/Rv2252/BmrU family lipid kinase